MFERGFMDYHADRFTDFSLMFYEDNKLVALLPASIHGDEIRSHGGLTYGGIISGNKMKQHRMNDCFDALETFLRENNIKSLLYKRIPYIFYKAPADEDLYPLQIKGAKLIRRDVSTTIDLTNPSKMPKGRKAQISRAKRENISIEESNNFEKFLELENKILSERHNTKAVHSAEELRLLKSRFENRIHLFIATKDNSLLAASLIFEYDNLVHTQYMASSELGRELGALDLLISTLMEKYKNKKYFDFGISTEQNGTIFNTGLCAQKESFGGHTVCYDFYEWRL